MNRCCSEFALCQFHPCPGCAIRAKISLLKNFSLQVPPITLGSQRLLFLDRICHLPTYFCLPLTTFIVCWTWISNCNETNIAQAAEPLVAAKATGAIRIATYNVSLNRNEAGQLKRDLEQGDAQIAAVAAVIRTVRPDVLLLNEVDYAVEFSNTANSRAANSNAELFQQLYLAKAPLDLLGNPAWPMPGVYSAPVNTGVRSGLDLNANGQLDDPEDAWGFGRFPGQYGMAVLTRFEIDQPQVQTLQSLPWSTMPGAMIPRLPDSERDYYAVDTWKQLRLASKSFWDVPVKTPLGTLHVLASHPTPPAFDGPEDRNGCRNHDEIKLIEHYINRADFLIADSGARAGLQPADSFVVLGDLNSDPQDGNSRSAAIVDLLNHPRMARYSAPRSPGAVLAAQTQAGANRNHRGDPAEDTGDFNDRQVGNLRIDYALPSQDFRVVASGVFWPDESQLADDLRVHVRSVLEASDHHLVWIDVVRAN
jgi:endonuclease/exonuclease/phosphatase family metal-dependent hydrolase